MCNHHGQIVSRWWTAPAATAGQNGRSRSVHGPAVRHPGIPASVSAVRRVPVQNTGSNEGSRPLKCLCKSFLINDFHAPRRGQHLNDSWDLDHPFERLLIDTAVAPDAGGVSWINPRIQPGEVRRVVTGVPGKTGVVYTLDRETGEFLWARNTVTQNVISDIDGATGAVTENAELVFSALGQEVLACPTWNGGKDWESVYSSIGASIVPIFIAVLLI